MSSATCQQAKQALASRLRDDTTITKWKATEARVVPTTASQSIQYQQHQYPEYYSRPQVLGHSHNGPYILGPYFPVGNGGFNAGCLINESPIYDQNGLAQPCNKYPHTDATGFELSQDAYSHPSNPFNTLGQCLDEAGQVANLRCRQLSTIPDGLFDNSDITGLDLSNKRLDALASRDWQSPQALAAGPKKRYARDNAQSLIKYLQETAPELEAPQARTMVDLDHFEEATENDKISVLSYNTLSPVLATPERYSSVPTNVLARETRRAAILDEIKEQSADVVYLQEIDAESYDGPWTLSLQILGYRSVFWSKRREGCTEEEKTKVDGCATFYRASKFKLLTKRLIDLKALALQNAQLHDKYGNVSSRVGRRDNIAVFTLLRNRHTDACIMVANTHLVANPVYTDVKAVQAAVLLRELEALGTHYAQRSNKGADIPLILAGDFNSLPNSAVYQLLSTGYLEPAHPDSGPYTHGMLTTLGHQHRLPLRSAYAPMGEMPFTTYTPNLKGTIDYIWYSTRALAVARVLGPVDDAYTRTVPGFPSKHFPSDHVKLVAEFVVNGDRRVASQHRELFKGWLHKNERPSRI